jgi:hypothetical protein
VIHLREDAATGCYKAVVTDYTDPELQVDFFFFTLVAEGPYTSSLRPHALVADGRIHWLLKAAYTSSSRPHTLVA